MTEAGGSTEIDSAIYTTMPLEDMIDRPGRPMYDILMLKMKCWKVMRKTSFSTLDWKTWVERSMNGIISSTESKHGIGKPYVHMEDAMIMATMVVRDSTHIRIRIRIKDSLPIPALVTPPNINQGTCSSALTKITVSMYQKRIDLAKHGSNKGRIMAVKTLIKETEECFGFMNLDGKTTIALMPISVAIQSTNPYTKLSYISQANTPAILLQRAIIVASMVEELDDISLADEERLAAAVFFAFSSRKVNEIISDNQVSVMSRMKADWYTSITCSNISWLKWKLRSSDTNSNVNMKTDVTSISGSVFLGNTCLFAPFASSKNKTIETINSRW